MLSEAISLRRLKFYEAQCRNGRAAAGHEMTRNELLSFELSFRSAAEENAAVLSKGYPEQNWSDPAE